MQTRFRSSMPRDCAITTTNARNRRRVDIRLLPILGALYTISLIDRTNISAARISGIDLDLDLAVGSRASIARKFLLTEDLFLHVSDLTSHSLGLLHWLCYL